MKNSISRTAFAAMTAFAVCLGAPWNVSSAQSISANQAAAAQAQGLPSGVSEVVKLFKGGIPADTMVSYVNNSPLSFYLSADNLIALQQEGVPATVLTAMMRRYGELQRQAGTAAGARAQTQAAAPQSVPQYAGAPVQAPAQAPAPQYYSYAPAPPPASYTYVAAPSYPVYSPSYYYDPYYYPWYPFGGPVVFDFGFGRFGGGFGGHWGGGGRFGGGWRR
jgi:hypothetical protein